MKNDSRASIYTIKPLLNFLLAILDKPENYAEDKEVMDALKSQGSTSKLFRPSAGIRMCSLNTLKSSANKELSGGFAEFDHVRRTALTSLLSATTKADTPNRRTKADLEFKIEQLTEDNDLLASYNSNLVWIVAELMRKCHRFTKHSPIEVKELCLKELDEIQRMINSSSDPKLISALYCHATSPTI